MGPAKRRLLGNSFDYGLVGEKEVVVGLVARADLCETDEPLRLDPPVRKLTLDEVIPEETPIEDLMRYLTKNAFQVVVRGKEVVGVVDVSDLNKNPVYTYFYLLLSLLEQNLLSVVRRLPADTKWESKIGVERWGGCEERWQGARKSGIELDQLYYLYLADYLSIVGKTPKLLQSLNFPSKNQWDRYVGSLDNLRNDVMHPVRDLVGSHSGIGDLFSIEQRIRELIRRTSRSISAGVEATA
jgi:hypothetical protein